MKKYTKIILWILTTAGWTIINLLLGLWLTKYTRHTFKDELAIASAIIIVVGIFIILARSSTRNPVEFSSRSHHLFKGSKADDLFTHNHGRMYGYDYNWKFFVNGYSILSAGIIGIIIDLIIIAI